MWTKGPWRASQLSKAWGIYEDDGTCIAKTANPFGVADERHEANARLIATAPEMYAALKALRAATTNLPENWQATYAWTIHAALHALHKARGE